MAVVAVRTVMRVQTRATLYAEVRFGRPNPDSAVGIATPVVQRLAAKKFRPADRDDAIQQALLKIVVKLPRYNPERGHRFLAWASTVAENSMNDKHRRDAARVQHHVDELREEDGADRAESSASHVLDNRRRVRDYLTGNKARLFDLKASGLSHEEIARQLNCSREAADKRVSRLYAECKKIAKECQIETG